MNSQNRQNSQKLKPKKNKKKLKLKKSTKIILFLSLLFSGMYIYNVAINSLFFWLKPKSLLFHINMNFTLPVTGYVIGRTLMYLYFTFRARDTFEKTFLKYKQSTLVIVVVLAALNGIGFTVLLLGYQFLNFRVMYIS